jgi:hypothetical protein
LFRSRNKIVACFDQETKPVLTWTKKQNRRLHRNTKQTLLWTRKPHPITDWHGCSLLHRPLPFRTPKTSVTDTKTYWINILYKDHYRKWRVQDSVRNVKEVRWGSKVEKFVGHTTYTQDFCNRSVGEKCNVLMRPKPTVLVNGHQCYSW